MPSESVLQSSFEVFASIHVLVFGFPFIVSQRLGGWVVSERLANKPAWSSSYSPVLIKSYFISSAILYISASSESKVISESDEVEDIVTKNGFGKIASTLVQNRRPDWDSRSVRSRFDVTALTLPRFPMRGREPSETRF